MSTPSPNPTTASTNRMAYRRANQRTAPLHQQVRLKFMELDKWVEDFSVENHLDGRSVAVVRTKLDEAIMWMNRAVALLNDIDPEPDQPSA